MTARPPTETLEGLSDGSAESPAGQAGTGHETNGAGAHASGGSQHPTEIDAAEASISKTLEAILSKSDDDESPFSSSDDVGTKTLLGMNAADFLPAAARSHDHDGIDIKSEDPISGVTVDDLFAESDDQPQVMTKAGPAGDDTQVGNLLGEVAEALNVQAAESRQRALGRSTSGPTPAVVAARPARPPKTGTPEEFEFEDPDDGPTSLNSKAEEEADVASGSKVEDEEEAVVLGPARKSDAHVVLSSGPASRNAAPGSSRPVPGTRRPTPFGGSSPAMLPTFPTPAGGRSRLPTPAPGQVVNVPAPAGARSALPTGRPSAAHVTLDSLGGPLPAASGRDSSRRTVTRAGTPSAGSDTLEGGGAIGESLASSAMTTASTILKKDLRLRLMSLAAIVVVTFVGGMLLGRLNLKSKGGGATVTGETASGEAVKTPVKPAAREDEVALPGGAPPPAVANPASGGVAAAPAMAVVPDKGTINPETTADPVAVVDPPPLHKVRARRASPVAKDDLLAKVSAPKPAARPAPAPFPGPAPKVAPKPAKKAKSGWHDPFAD